MPKNTLRVNRIYKQPFVTLRNQKHVESIQLPETNHFEINELNMELNAWQVFQKI